MLCLVQFLDDWQDFRVAELKELLRLFNIEEKLVEFSGENGLKSDLFQYLELPSAVAAEQLCSRSVLIKAVYEVWTHGSTFEGLVQATQELCAASSSPLPTDPSEDQLWHVQVVPCYKNLKVEEKERCKEALSFLSSRLGEHTPHVKKAAVTITVLVNYETHRRAISSCSFAEKGGAQLPTVPCFCGRLLARGQMKDELTKYQLKKRLFLGPTTLDHVLSMLLCNLAGVQQHHMVLDPFVGTASLLVAASHLKAYCMGTDIDIRVLKGGMYAGASRDAGSKKVANSASTPGSEEPVQRTTRETFRSYNLTPPEIVRMDLHNLKMHLEVPEGGLFDCIVTDPPYGIRAGGRKSGRGGDAVTRKVDPEMRHNHIPATQIYPVEEVMLDLLHAAAHVLVLGGTLCYLIPTPYDFEPSDLPRHPCFELQQICLQSLSTRHGRSAVLLRKTQAYTDTLRASFDGYRNCVMQGRDSEFGALMSKLERALLPGAHDDDSVIKRKSNTCERRRASKAAKAARRQVHPEKTSADAFSLAPEEQHALYVAIRDGDVKELVSLLKQGSKGSLHEAVNSTPFESLWHEPGPEATPLHLAAACLQVQVVQFLLDNGANVTAKANGRLPADLISTIDLFAAAAVQRPGDADKIRSLLSAAATGKTKSKQSSQAL